MNEDLSPQAIAAARAATGIPADRWPRHVAIIMDGNGRWARSRGLPRPAGHEAGAEVVSRIVAQAAKWGLEAITLYSFSLENWRRPREEVQALMHLYAYYLRRERSEQMANNIRLRHLGRRDGLPQSVLDELDESVRQSGANSGMYLCLALNYGSRAEIVDAVRRIATDVRQGKLAPEQIGDQTIDAALDSHGIPDPDLLVRTAGEHRISNFLLWQISYAELYVTDVLWPDFSIEELAKAIGSFAGRHRRFGGLDATNS